MQAGHNEIQESRGHFDQGAAFKPREKKGEGNEIYFNKKVAFYIPVIFNILKYECTVLKWIKGIFNYNSFLMHKYTNRIFNPIAFIRDRFIIRMLRLLP